MHLRIVLRHTHSAHGGVIVHLRIIRRHTHSSTEVLSLTRCFYCNCGVIKIIKGNIIERLVQRSFTECIIIMLQMLQQNFRQVYHYATIRPRREKSFLLHADNKCADQPAPGGGGGGVLSFFPYVGSGPASTVHPKKYPEFPATPKSI